jgi:hypothetical protein
MNIRISSIPASPVSQAQTGSSLVPAPQLFISRYAPAARRGLSLRHAGGTGRVCGPTGTESAALRRPGRRGCRDPAAAGAGPVTPRLTAAGRACSRRGLSAQTAPAGPGSSFQPVVLRFTLRLPSAAAAAHRPPALSPATVLRFVAAGRQLET